MFANEAEDNRDYDAVAGANYEGEVGCEEAGDEGGVGQEDGGAGEGEEGDSEAEVGCCQVEYDVKDTIHLCVIWTGVIGSLQGQYVLLNLSNVEGKSMKALGGGWGRCRGGKD